MFFGTPCPTELAGALMEHSSPRSSSYFASRSLDVEVDSEASSFLVGIEEVTWDDRYLFTVEFWKGEIQFLYDMV